MHALSLWQVITGRQTVIFTIATRFPHEETWDWTHTHSVTSCDDERRIRLLGHNPSMLQSPQHLTLISEASQSFFASRTDLGYTALLLAVSVDTGMQSHQRSVLMTVSPTTQASPELRTFCQNYSSLGCFPHLQDDSGQSKFHCLPASRTSLQFTVLFDLQRPLTL